MKFGYNPITAKPRVAEMVLETRSGLLNDIFSIGNCSRKLPIPILCKPIIVIIGMASIVAKNCNRLVNITDRRPPTVV